MLLVNLVKTNCQVVGAIRPGGGEFPERVGQPVCQVCGLHFFSQSTFELAESFEMVGTWNFTFDKCYSIMFPYVQIV